MVFGCFLSPGWSDSLYTMFENICTPSLKMCLHQVWRCVYTMCKDKFTSCLKTCIRLVWRPLGLKAPCMMTCLHVWRLVYKMCGKILTTCLSICLHHVSKKYLNHIQGNFYNMFCVCVCACAVHVCMCLCKLVSTNSVYEYVCIMCINVFISKKKSVYVRMWAYARVCVYVCMYVYVCVCVHV